MERDKLVKLVTEAQKGDSKSMNLLFNEFYNDVYYFALKTVKNEDVACDVTQETFVEIIKTLNNLKEPAAFVTWMKQIAYHQCTRYFKKKKDILVDEDENEICDTCEAVLFIVIDFYSVNDLHGKFCDTDSQPGVDELSTYIKNARESDDHVILLSAGDMWQGAAESVLTNGASR